MKVTKIEPSVTSSTSETINGPSRNVAQPDITSEQSKEEQVRIKATEESVEKENEEEEEVKPVKKRVNNFKLIYPSSTNTEPEYMLYMTYANLLYQQFTGSFSKRMSRIDIQPLNADKVKNIQNPQNIEITTDKNSPGTENQMASMNYSKVQKLQREIYDLQR